MPSNRLKPRQQRRGKKHSINSSTSGTPNNFRSRAGGRPHNQKKGSLKKSQKNKKKNGWRFFQSDLLKHLNDSDRQESRLAEQESTLEDQESTVVEQERTVISKKTTQSTNAEDLPTTSAKAAARATKFKKFLDNSKRKTSQHIRMQALKRLNTNAAANRVVVNKLLHSIKRRQQQHLNKSTSTQKTPCKDLRRKLNFPTVKNTQPIITSTIQSNANDRKAIVEKVKAAVTLEEGEIISSDDDDDCIFIEPKVELITIEDENYGVEAAKVTSQCIEIAALKQSENIKNIKAITSTPLEKNKPKTLNSSAPNSPSPASAKKSNKEIAKIETNSNDVVLFFEDVSRVNWLETITSEDTFANYNRTTMTLGSDEKPARRSRRLRGKDAEITVDDIILIDDCTLKPEASYETFKGKCASDDSVVFVNEQTPNEFIPLEADNVPNPIKFVPNPLTPNRKHTRDISLFTQSEKKQLTKYNENAYNPAAGVKQPKGKRMVIIDGSNVAYNHGLNREFSVKGLKICLDYFEKMGHEVKAIVPQFRLCKYKSSAPEELEALHRAGKIVFTPCKNLPGAKSSSYDDRFVLQIACELDAAVVSNDNYRDLIHETPAMKKIIENRVIGYIWCNDIFMLPKDPYGRFGPTLHSILNR